MGLNDINITNNTKTFGDNKWDVKITLENHSENKIWHVNNAAWNHLVIEHGLHDWPIKGFIEISNPGEGIERSHNAKTQEEYEKSEGGEGEYPDPPYFYRMDGRDEITIHIKNPEMEDQSNEFWEININAIIYDTQDIESPSVTEKSKRFYFWDKRYQLMQEKHIEFSTASIAHRINEIEKPISQLTDSERSIKSGIALKELLIAAGFEDSIDNETWDDGMNDIFYTSLGISSVDDDVKNILDEHISEEGDRCILYFNRGLGDHGKWQLIPIHKFFDKAGNEKDKPGEYQIEHFFIEDWGEGSGTSPYKAPKITSGGANLMVDLDLDEFGRISAYEFVDMSGVDNASAINDRPVYWYDSERKKFGVDFQNNAISNVKTKFNDLYVKKLYAANEPYPLLTLNKMKSEHYNINPQFTYSGSETITPLERTGEGAAKSLFAGIFLNECIHFTVLGSTHRIPGRFIGIDRKSDIVNNYLDNKLCGQWFVVNTKHIMYLDKYITEITAVKIHA